MEEKFRLDRTAFSAGSFQDANDHVSYWKDKTYKERLEAAWFLIMHAYGIDENTRMDKTIFEVRTR